jgi:phosphomannomutase
VALVYYVVHQFGACGGVMVTGGPYAADRGGFKICGTRALPIGTATGLASIRDIAGRVPRHRSGATSKVTRRDMTRVYRQFIRRFTHTPRPAEKPVSLVADAMGGVAGRWIPRLFAARCGMDIHPLHFEPNCLGRTRPDPASPRQQTVLRRAVRARRASFGIGFDGDADRCTILDERGGLVPPDRVAALLARRFIEREPGAAIVFDLRFSNAAFEEVLRAGGSVFRERVGSAHIKKTMTDRHAVFGADLDGRYFYRDNAFSESAMLTMVHVANLLRETGRTLSDLVRPLNRYRTSDEVRLPSDDADRAIRRLVSAHQGAEIEEIDGVTVRYDDWWLHARPDDVGNLSVVVEARTRKLVDQHLADLEHFLTGIDAPQDAPVGAA